MQLNPTATKLATVTAVTVMVAACTTTSASAGRALASRTTSGGSVVVDSGGKRDPVGLPADWPRTVPLPSGVLTATSGRAPRWSVLLVVDGSAPAVQRHAIAFYVARGWRRTGVNGLHKGVYSIGLGAANRDHSARKSNLTIALSKS